MPAKNPRLVISVIIDESKEEFYGGTVAAPVFRRIAEQSLLYLKVKVNPDLLASAQKPQKMKKSKLPVIPIRKLKTHEPTSKKTTLVPGQMPDLKGLTLREALHRVQNLEIPIEIRGVGLVIDQYPPPGGSLQRKKTCTLIAQPLAGLAPEKSSHPSSLSQSSKETRRGKI